MCRGRSLDHAIFVLKSVFGTARDNDTELRCNDIQSFGYVFSDQNFCLARMLRQVFRFDHHLNTLQMRRKALAWPRWTFTVFVDATRNLGPDRRNAGLDLLKDKGMLLVIDTGRCKFL